jgi:hypothetical protein
VGGGGEKGVCGSDFFFPGLDELEAVLNLAEGC